MPPTTIAASMPVLAASWWKACPICIANSRVGVRIRAFTPGTAPWRIKRGQPDPLGELQVVADHHGDPAEVQVDDGRRRVTGGEDELLLIPQVRLAVHGPGPGRVDDG